MDENNTVRNTDILTSIDQNIIKDIMLCYKKENQPKKLAYLLDDMYDLIERLILN